MLHELWMTDAIVVECGGTSTNVSVVRGGRAQLRSLRVMRQPTFIRAVDSWVVGVAGGSMAVIGRRGIADVGPRSAHIAGLPYASFATRPSSAARELALVAPRPGDPEAYACVDAEGGRFALTATCAANALGLVPAGVYPDSSHGRGARRVRAAGAAAPDNARPMLRARCSTVPCRRSQPRPRRRGSTYRLAQDVPLVALGGAGAALVPEVARRLRRHAELPRTRRCSRRSGAAVSLVRAEVARTIGRDI